jgi:hypothetical protein
MSVATLDAFMSEKLWENGSVSPNDVVENRFAYADIWKRVLESSNRKRPVVVLWPRQSPKPLRIFDDGIYRLAWARFADIEVIPVCIITEEVAATQYKSAL